MKWRCIDDAKASMQNAAHEATERIHTTSTLMAISVVRRLRQLIGAPLVGPFGVLNGTEDMEDAYHKVPRADADANVTIIAIWHPLWECWAYSESVTMLFGLSPAVLHFNRLPAFIVAVARRWLALPVISFFDDFRTFDLQMASPSVARWLRRIMEWLGWSFSDRKRYEPNVSVPFLGVVEDYSVAADDWVHLRPKEGRQEAIHKIVGDMYKRKRVSSGEALSLRGKWLHLCTTIPGRMARGHLFGLNDACTWDTPSWSPQLDHALCFMDAVMKLPIGRWISLVADHCDHYGLWTDASFSYQNPEYPSRLCFILSKRGSSGGWGAVLDVPETFFAQLPKRCTHITMAEALAPLVMLIFQGENLRGLSRTTPPFKEGGRTDPGFL
jgi:hypothetical protein